MTAFATRLRNVRAWRQHHRDATPGLAAMFRHDDLRLAREDRYHTLAGMVRHVRFPERPVATGAAPATPCPTCGGARGRVGSPRFVGRDGYGEPLLDYWHPCEYCTD